MTVAPELIARVDWRGRVLTGDALFCQRHLCRQVLEAGGDYVLLVKANQPTLYRDLELLFDPPPDGPPPLPLLDRREARTVETGHGRQADTRHLVASTDLTGYLDWPGLAQVFRLERTWREHGQTTRLLALKRGHWLIEHRLHRSKAVTLGEDASLVHTGQGPTILALLRDTALSVLRRAGYRAITARLRYHSQHPEAAAALLCDPASTRA